MLTMKICINSQNFNYSVPASLNIVGRRYSYGANGEYVVVMCETNPMLIIWSAEETLKIYRYSI